MNHERHEKHEKKRKGLVPKLRFPEFRDSGEWENCKLGDKEISFFVKEKIAIEQVTLVNYVSTENLLPNYDGVTVASKLPPNGSCTRFNAGDILISNIRPYLKKVWAANRNGGSSNDVIVVRSKSKIEKVFLALLLRNDDFINYVMKGAKGVKMPRGDISLMKEYPIALPKHPEQQKIADCLTSLDELITAEAGKLEAYKAHKKGLMQKIFPADTSTGSVSGETVPEWRFPEFRDAGEWKTYFLIDIALEKLSNGVFNDPNKVGSGYKLINVLDMYTDTYIDETALSLVDITEKEFKKNKVECGDIFFTRSSLVKAGIAQSNIYLGNADDITFDGHLIRLRPNNKNIFPLYIHFALKSESVRSQLIAKGKTATMTTIGQSDIANTKICIPMIDEQQKIADCLTSLDELITAQAQKIDTLKTHKKGLMQGLFPSAEEAR